MARRVRRRRRLRRSRAKNASKGAFRKGKPLAAYLYLPRANGARVTRTVDAGQGVRVDIDERDVPIGIEITAPGKVTVAELNAVLVRYGFAALDAAEWAPLAA